ncbi:MAG TPA: hypothetical protein VFN35_09305 [Ktedonobacteraceae bacterium]|nr:hypothetical protein [Ktedonobacteraceae bacterium]
MDTGILITVMIVGLLFLLIFFLPALLGISAKSKSNNPGDAAREAAYRRGLMIGSLMEQARETQHADPQHILEQVVIDQTIIEHLQHQNDHKTSGKERHHP